jgi:hypothetical protein
MDNFCIRMFLLMSAWGAFGCRSEPVSTVPSRDSDPGSGGPGGGAGPVVDAPPERYLFHTFRRQTLDTEFRAEGANFADLDRDGNSDLIAGSYWYRGPEFTSRVPYYVGRTFDGATGYSDDFFIFTDDLDADGWLDILQIGFPGQETFWYRNPGGDALAAATASAWKRHTILATTDNESPTYADLTGDGKRELVCIHKGDYGYATPQPGDATAPWQFHRITQDGGRINFTHGMGVGDVNGDGRQDLLERAGGSSRRRLWGIPPGRGIPSNFHPGVAHKCLHSMWMETAIATSSPASPRTTSASPGSSRWPASSAS